MKVILGSRGSLLALTQARGVAADLGRLHPSLQIEIRIIKTTGDKILDSPLSQIGDKGLFVKEIETALENREIDLAVHSVKDLPSILPEPLALAAIPPREDPSDVLVTRENIEWDKLPQNAVIGTSALRRQSQLLFHRPDLNVRVLRGNVDTRLRKLDSGEYFGIVLARAGLNRLGIDRGVPIPRSVLLPSPGQGALAIEVRKDNTELMRLAASLNHPPTAICVDAERAFLAEMEGGCQVPLGAYAELTGTTLSLEGFVGSPDGKILLREKTGGGAGEAAELGRKLARILQDRGGKEIIRSLMVRSKN